MIKFKELFRFSTKEASSFVAFSKLKARIKGLKLLTVEECDASRGLSHGRLLIITPKACGKANLRNQFRRRVKNIFFQEKLYEKPELFVIIASKSGVLYSYSEIKSFLIRNILPRP